MTNYTSVSLQAYLFIYERLSYKFRALYSKYWVFVMYTLHIGHRKRQSEFSSGSNCRRRGSRCRCHCLCDGRCDMLSGHEIKDKVNYATNKTPAKLTGHWFCYPKEPDGREFNSYLMRFYIVPARYSCPNLHWAVISIR